MGFMTEVSILNDSWHLIKENPDQLVAAIAHGLHEDVATTHAVHGKTGIHVNPITVYPSHHADDPRLYLAYRNSFISLDCYDVEREYGLRLVSTTSSLLDVLEHDVAVAEDKLKRLKGFLKEKRVERG